MRKSGFDNQMYLETQSQHIRERISQFDNKLYLEFGGKLFDDEHASRVLPGFASDSKLRMLMKLSEQVEILICINANDIANNKMRGDLGISYDLEVLRLIDAFQAVGLYVGSVVITQFSQQPAASAFRKHLEKLGVKSYLHYPIEGYPNNVTRIVSEEGFGKNEYVETTHPLVVVTAPGPGSGKMATCLSQLYQEYRHGVNAGYAKFETFPIWNLPLKHPVNLAYEAATADLNDIDMIDPFHLEAYGETTVNYNRDVEVFPVLQAMMEKISGTCPYKSPTDMGVNRVGFCITDDAVVRQAGRDEIIRRYYTALCDFKEGKAESETIDKLELLMTQAQVTPEMRSTVQAARDKAEQSGEHAVALQLDDGRLITGRRTLLLGAPSSCLLNALKALAKIDDAIPLISPHIIEPVVELKTKTLGNHNPRLYLNEVLIALAISATTNPLSHLALEQIRKLENCELHSTVILDEMEKNILRKLKIRYTSDPKFRSKKLFH
ncbi:MAG: DUF1846 domain-containing protein [Ndongobacter sp.]|nr:DUF1846 domain-containing protein [Ndongobacter sp.]